MYDNHPVAPPATPEDGYHLSKDLADKTIEFIRDSKVIAPGQAVVLLRRARAPATRRTTSSRSGPTSTPGRFDMGYERYREIVLENQKRLGIVPPDTELSPMNPYSDVKGPNGEAVAAAGHRAAVGFA